MSPLNGVRDVLNELLFFRSVDGRLFFRVEQHPLPAGVMPDQHVRDVATRPGAGVPTVVHSTSWRCDPRSGAITLTWAVLPDPWPNQPVREIPRNGVRTGADAAHPVPDDLDLMDVAAHAARHLAFLSHTDPALVTELHRCPDLHDALLPFIPDVAANHSPVFQVA